MAKSKSSKFDAAGWTFWIIVFVVLLAPTILLAKRMVYRTAEWYVTGAISVMLDAIVTSFVTWGINAVLQQRDKKRRMAERKKARKRK